MARFLYFTLFPARLPAISVAGMTVSDGKVETNNNVVNDSWGKAPKITLSAGVTVPTPIVIKAIANTANPDKADVF